MAPTAVRSSRPPLAWRGAMLAALLLAAGLRLAFPDWDGGIAAHPDERYLLGVTQNLGQDGNPCLAQVDFPYGHLPVYLARLLVLAAPAADPLVAARLFSGLCGVLLVALVAACGRVLAGRGGALPAAVVAAGAPFLVQQGHYTTVDPLASIFVTASILAAARRRPLVAGMLGGLAVACKLSAAWVFVPLAVAASGVLSPGCAAAFLRRRAAPTGGALLSLGLGAAAAFALSSPWAVLTPTACWRGPLTQVAMAAGRFDFPYTRQYAGTWPWLYPAVQMALWGLGPAAAAAGVLGLLSALRQWRNLPAPARVLLLWSVVGFAALGGTAVKFPRYLLPIYPVWIAWAVDAMLRVGRGRASRAGLCRALMGAVALTTLALGLAQVSAYARPHPWVLASRWIYANLPAGSVIAVEAWDHPLPVPLPEGTVEAYTQVVLPVFDEDSPVKLEALERSLQEADVIVLASHRGYGALARLPERYAATMAWYVDVLRERDLIVFGRCPSLGGLALSDDPLRNAGLPPVVGLPERCGTASAVRLPRLDESFRVYEHPTVLLALKPPASLRRAER